MRRRPLLSCAPWCQPFTGSNNRFVNPGIVLKIDDNSFGSLGDSQFVGDLSTLDFLDGNGDPATSVVDAQGRTHDVANLYVFDGSVWPTSAGMNPTATIAALALRFTEQLIASRREQKVAA